MRAKLNPTTQERRQGGLVVRTTLFKPTETFTHGFLELTLFTPKKTSVVLSPLLFLVLTELPSSVVFPFSIRCQCLSSAQHLLLSFLSTAVWPS